MFQGPGHLGGVGVWYGSPFQMDLAVRFLNFLKGIKGKPIGSVAWLCWEGFCSNAVQPGAALCCTKQF